MRKHALTWSEDLYSVTLLSGADKVCIGVNSETKQ